MRCQQGIRRLVENDAWHRLFFRFKNIATGRRRAHFQHRKHSGNMAAVVAPSAILTSRVVAPKARATRTLKATTFKGAKLAQPKVRPETHSSGVIYFRDI
jgi:hypothetical protein